MDLNQQDTVKAASEGAWLHLKGPDGVRLFADDATRKKPMRIHLLGGDAREVREYRHRLNNKRLNAGFRQEETTLDQTETDSISMLVECTIKFENIILDGNEVESNPLNAKMLYTRFPWIKEQVDAFIADRLNFLGNSSSAS